MGTAIEKKRPGRPRATPAQKAETQRKQRALQRENVAIGRAYLNEIDAIPARKDAARRRRCKDDFPLFCRTYMPAIFSLPWSDIHLKAAERIQTATMRGGMFAYAMPRGSGKTSQAEAAAIWAICYGHLSYVVIVGASEPSAERILRSIRTTFMTNDHLLADFPEICVPIRHMEGKPIRGQNQTYKGIRTAIEWTKNSLVLPTIPKSVSSGSIIAVRGITGEIRGMAHTRQDGTKIRPQLAICDDPQTRISAKSPAQSKTRAQTLASDIAYLAGPDKPIAVLVPCTVIYRDDMADRMLNRDIHPEFQGFRTRMVESFPENTELWDQYETILKSSLLDRGDIEPATKFYGENREAMDAGAEVTWAERMYPDELSAIQHAMNLKIRDEAAFWSEMQNEPVETFDSDGTACVPIEVLAKVRQYPQFMAMRDTEKLTAYIDCQGECLYYAICGWSPDFSGHVVDYGIWPEQRGNRRDFTLENLTNTFTRELGGRDEEHLYAALVRLCGHIVKALYPIDGGAEIRIDRILIDAQAGDMRDTVYQFCREQTLGLAIDPAHGKFVGASSIPWSEAKIKRREQRGPGWRYLPTEDWPIRHVLIDSNYWKTFVHRRMKADVAAKSSLSLYGQTIGEKTVGKAHHVDFADQFCAEYAVETEGRGRKVHEWKMRANTRNNHFLDCVAGCACAASIEGIELSKQQVPRRNVKKERVSFAAQAAQQR